MQPRRQSDHLGEYEPQQGHHHDQLGAEETSRLQGGDHLQVSEQSGAQGHQAHTHLGARSRQRESAHRLGEQGYRELGHGRQHCDHCAQ